MGHFVHNADINTPLAHTTPYMLLSIFPVQLKLGFICQEHTSPACQWPSKVRIFPLKSVYGAELQSSQDPDEDD
jgi:hypothetical protein